MASSLSRAAARASSARLLAGSASPPPDGSSRHNHPPRLVTHFKRRLFGDAEATPLWSAHPCNGQRASSERPAGAHAADNGSHLNGSGHKGSSVGDLEGYQGRMILFLLEHDLIGCVKLVGLKSKPHLNNRFGRLCGVMQPDASQMPARNRWPIEVDFNDDTRPSQYLKLKTASLTSGTDSLWRRPTKQTPPSRQLDPQPRSPIMLLSSLLPQGSSKINSCNKQSPS